MIRCDICSDTEVYEIVELGECQRTLEYVALCERCRTVVVFPTVKLWCDECKTHHDVASYHYA
jgi:hypothetical protein